MAEIHRHHPQGEEGEDRFRQMEVVEEEDRRRELRLQFPLSWLSASITSRAFFSQSATKDLMGWMLLRPLFFPGGSRPTQLTSLQMIHESGSNIRFDFNFAAIKTQNLKIKAFFWFARCERGGATAGEALEVVSVVEKSCP